jgi:MoaA/NifB/PqqE/SkfB family radical SAM enzyme
MKHDEPSPPSMRYAPPMKVPAIDIYATFRCNMRCRHCFVGDWLNLNSDFEWQLLYGLLVSARTLWGTEEIAYLGGEPTLYPHLHRAVVTTQELGYRTRIVSNGGKSLGRFLSSPNVMPLHVAISIDGATDSSHDAVRRVGSFSNALRSIQVARSYGHSVSAVLSVGRHNLSTAIDTLLLLSKLEVDYINVHYVTNRGYASRDLTVPLREWLAFREDAARLPIARKIRFERTYVPNDRPLNCAVRNESMLMFFPDARVYQCSMFLHLPDAHSFIWNGSTLECNDSFVRRYLTPTEIHCPAMPFVNSNLCEAAESANLKIGCIFDKEEFIPLQSATSTGFDGVTAKSAGE